MPIVITDRNKPMNRKLILVLFTTLVVVGVAVLKFQSPEQPAKSQEQLAYQPVAVQEETIQLTLGPGAIFADSHFTVQQGKLINMLVSSTMEGMLNFTDQQGVVTSRPIAITPNNQFYLPSDHPGKYDITFEIPTGTYVLGSLTIQGAPPQ